MTQISLVKNQDHYQGALKVLRPLKAQLQTKVKGLEKIIIKINFVTTERKLATTPVETVKGFIDFVKPFFPGKFLIAEQASIGDTQQGFDDYGFTALAKSDSQVEVFDVAQDKADLVEIKFPNGKLELPLARVYTQSPFVVSITRAKTHNTVVVTLGIKNLLVGAIQGNLDTRVVIHKGMDIHWIMTEIAKFAYPDFVLLDATQAMEGDGPGHGDLIRAGWLAAGFDALAVDSLATYLMGFDIKDVGYLNLLHKEKFGKLFPKDKIEILGPKPDSLVKPFKPHPSFSSQRQWQQ